MNGEPRKVPAVVNLAAPGKVAAKKCEAQQPTERLYADAASSVRSIRLYIHKEQPVVPIVRAGLVESNLTPPGPLPVKQRARIFVAIVTTPPWQGFSCQLFTVN